MTNIIIYCGLWDHSGKEPVFICVTGKLDGNGVYTQFDGKDEPYRTTVDGLFNLLDDENDVISLTKEEFIKQLEETGEVDFCGGGHGAYLAVKA